MSSAVTPRSELPRTALLERDGKTQVGGGPAAKTVATRDVQVIERNDERIVLASGVQPGERVVTAGVNILKPGQKVTFDEDAR